MGAVAPLSVLLIGLVGMVIIAAAVVRIALLERRAAATLAPAAAPAPSPSLVPETEPWALPGAAVA